MKSQIYNIPPSVSFTDTLARGLLKETTKTPEKLANYLILLPTRRACRSLQDAFLRQSDGKPILLPQMKPFGDIDAEELLIAEYNTQNFDLPPAISSLERQILLAQTISKLPNFSKNPAQDMALANALGQLMDQIYTEDLDLSNLPHIVDREAFAQHWQITLDFLSILSEHWPKILKDRGVIDAADRRNCLIHALNKYWQNSPPNHPVIAAGSTGSIPATAKLLKTIAQLPKGSIILPGLDTHLSNNAWDDIEEGHPQATLKQLLNHLDYDRNTVKTWPFVNQDDKTSQTREKIFSHVMAPASQTDQWTKIHVTEKQQRELKESLSHITRYDCPTPQEEAQIIALIMRKTLENKEKTTALITPDRDLARRVAIACNKWHIQVNDSGGKTLNDSAIGQYLRLTAKAMIDGIKPLSLLSLLKHNYASGGGFTNFRATVRALDKQLLRGTTPTAGFNALKTKYQNISNNSESYSKPDPEILDLLNHLHLILQDGIDLFSNGSQDFKKLFKTHLKIAENLAISENKTAEEILWCGEEGEAAANFFSKIYAHADNIPHLNGTDYLAILEQFMTSITVRPRYGTHPRLMILGRLEARLIQADYIILGGLNEGSWPPDPGHDPWMSRPMRKNFGLPLPERSITLAAHDFVQGVCNAEVFLTRSERIDDAPSVPARWLQRLDTFLQAVKINPKTIHGIKYKNYALQLNQINNIKPIERPAPNPPVSERPSKLSVTKIETWLKDPYSIYASQILKLKKIDPLEKEFDVAERGTLLHDIMEKFTKKYPKNIPQGANDDFIQIAHDIIKKGNYDAVTWSFWKPRLKRLSDWIVDHEIVWRGNASFNKTEATGTITITENINTPFTLTARADRIDNLHDGTTAIIDYKSGGTYSMKKMENAELPQLPLEGLILEGNGFSEVGITNKKIGSLSYWKLTGGSEAGKVTEISNPNKIEQSLNFAKEGLIQLIQTFENPATPYIAIPRLDNAPTFNDYEHLERVKEWAALGENSEDTGEVA